MSREYIRLRAKKRPKLFHSEKSRVITKCYIPGSEERTKNIITRIMNLSNKEVSSLLKQVLREFAGRHRYFRTKLENNFLTIKHHLPENNLSQERKLLLGSYFTMEYSVEAAALFNPSMVMHPDQSGVEPGAARFLISFRATGEGHISSIEFRTGEIDKYGDIFFDPLGPYIDTPEIHTDRTYNNHLFRLKLHEMGSDNEITHRVLSQLPDDFTFEQLEKEIFKFNQEVCSIKDTLGSSFELMRWLAKSNYVIKFNPKHSLNERVLFPVSENESQGLEDARFVRFIYENNKVTYFATYTAFNGVNILPQLIETEDFNTFKIITLNGKAIQNKGMALFPRKINNQYVMLSRQDGENNHIMFSDNIHFWHESKIIQKPTLPWQFIQIGNSGSPIETKEGWLLLNHGVGAMRKYSIGAQLLDLEDPTKIIGQLSYPILVANEEERDGYVPNVVYSCGAFLYNGELIIPYAMSDSRCGIATISAKKILEEILKTNRPNKKKV